MYDFGFQNSLANMILAEDTKSWNSHICRLSKLGKVTRKIVPSYVCCMSPDWNIPLPVAGCQRAMTKFAIPTSYFWIILKAIYFPFSFLLNGVPSWAISPASCHKHVITGSGERGLSQWEVKSSSSSWTKLWITFNVVIASCAEFDDICWPVTE